MSDAGRAVLILEDDQGHAALQRRALERAGYATIVTHSAEEAMRSMTQTPPELIVVDHQLRSDYTGIAFCASLLASGMRIPIVMVSASSDERIVVDALRVGVRDFLLKDSDFFATLPVAVS